MIRGFRTRLVVTFVSLVTLTSVVLGAGSYLFVSRSLHERLVQEGVSQTEFNVAILAPERLPPSPTREDFEASGLDRAFRLRGGEVYVDFGVGDPYASRFSVRATPEIVSPRLTELVAGGRLAYEWVRVEDVPYLVTGARLPPDGPDFYFYYPAAGVEAALLRMREALLIGGALLVAGAALMGGLVARRVLRPVGAAARAAGRMAAGELSVRLPVESPDEFGSWAASFNRMAASLEQKLGELESAYAAQRRFVADVSHELRTPLTTLAGAASMLESRLERLDPDERRLTELLIENVRRLRTTVEDLMEISRLDAAPERPDLASIRLAPFLQAVADAHHPEARVEVEDVTVRADRRRLERIVGNLLDNARHHASGAPVELRTGLREGSLEVSVADRGPGVPESELERIFERFHKADPSRSGEGSGLGLAIAAQHARLLGGHLSARLREGGGMVFRLRLPVTEPLPGRDAPVTPDRDPGGRTIPHREEPT